MLTTVLERASDLDRGTLLHARSNAVRFDTLHVRANSVFPTSAWYDAFSIAQSRFVVAIGDVCASAAEAAALALRVRAAFSTSAASASGALVGAAHVVRDSRTAGATALVGIVDTANRTFTYVCVGHLPPLVRYQDGTVVVLPSDGIATGALALDSPQAQVSVNLDNAALLLLYSKAFVSVAGLATGSPSIQRTLADERLAEGVDPTLWLAQQLLTAEHADAALLSLTFANKPASPAARRPAGARPSWSVSWLFDATGSASNGARRTFIKYLTCKNETGAAIDLEAAELIFGELLGNVVRHAPGLVEITLDWSDQFPVLHVLDNGPGFRSRRGRERLPVDSFSECGRGLFIINSCAARFTIRNRAGRGTHACVQLPPAA